MARSITTRALKIGDNPAHVRETLGLSETELAEALQHAELSAPEADTKDNTSAPEAADPAHDSTTDADRTEALERACT
ncbi:hypothetical protein [Streptomyces sp. NRRL B-3648]|uniref:hypothetical protein n=1 Tax=Streptomyces sp. NRRL B-3648 TaxID=1519493 RepID=UPI0006B04C00|nr:hypothetical protein [Streptomyces sp. NRRL B-3648]KOX11570.1 hypothetical protein ADL04_01500 [Streptomyces sp. NRRL B-3648]